MTPDPSTDGVEISGPPTRSRTWWMEMIREAELDERMWSGDKLPDAVAVARRLLDMVEEMSDAVPDGSTDE
jgi:hypothetical protein